MGKKILVFTTILLLIFVVPSYAHKPIFEINDLNFANPSIVPNHQISYVIYGQLQTKKDVDFVKFNAKEKDTFFIHLTIPIIKGNEDFKPYIALIGKGIKEKAVLPFTLPESYGAIVLPPGEREYFYEKFTQTSYYKAQSIRGEIPESGDYYVAIYSYDRGGKYSLTIGEEEKFSIIDLISFPYMYLRVKYFFSPGKTLLLIAGIIIVVVAIIKIIKRRR